MAPSNARGQTAWSRDAVNVVKEGGGPPSSSPLEQRSSEQLIEKKSPSHSAKTISFTLTGGPSEGAIASHAPPAEKAKRNIFESIADFFLRGNSTREKDITPATTAGSALSSSGDESATESHDGDPAPLDYRWGSETNVMARPPAENINCRRSRPIAIGGTNKARSGQTMASPNGDSGERPGRGAGTQEDQEGGADGGEEEEEEKNDVGPRDKIGEWRRMCAAKKRVSFTEETFVPCYAAVAPNMSSESFQEIKYKAPERRVPSAVAPPSSVARPNYHDALRRVSVVVYQHIKTCQWKRQEAEQRERAATKAGIRSPAPMKSFRRSAPSLVALRRNESALWAEGGRGGARPVAGGAGTEESTEEFNAHMAEVFNEKHFVSPTYRYNFMHAPMMALPGILYTLKEVETKPKTPTVDEIYHFIKTLFNKACLSSECSLVCLIYVERLMETARVPLLASTWKPVLLCGLLLASKVWQDLSSWNVEFSTVYPEYSLKSINRLELLFLSAMKWDMSISSSLYAKYYFALRSLTEKEDFRRRYNRVLQIDAPRANTVEARANAVRRDVINPQSVCMLSKSL